MATPEPSLADDLEALEARYLEQAVAAARASVAAGQVVDHDLVRAWLLRLERGELAAPMPEPPVG